MSNYSFFIGIDVSKSVIDVSYSSELGIVYLGQFANRSKGFISMYKALSKLTSESRKDWFFCFENTGVYSKPLLEWLASKELTCREENAMKISRSLGFRRGKTDKIDSGDICNYAYEKRETLKPTILPSKTILRLKNLLYRRKFLVAKRAAIKVSVSERNGFMEKGLYQEFKRSNDIIVEAFNKEIKQLDKSLEELIKSDETIAENNKLIKSVVGIGPITSAYIIAITQNFTCFNDSRKFCCYSGIAPFPNSSGTRKGNSRVSHIANKEIKSLLSNCIFSAIRHDPELAKYYNRKIDEGKRPGIVLNAIKNKIVHRVFAVVKRKTPYVKLMNYA